MKKKEKVNININNNAEWHDGESSEESSTVICRRLKARVGTQSCYGEKRGSLDYVTLRRTKEGAGSDKMEPGQVFTSAFSSLSCERKMRGCGCETS